MRVSKWVIPPFINYQMTCQSPIARRKSDSRVKLKSHFGNLTDNTKQASWFCHVLPTFLNFGNKKEVILSYYCLSLSSQDKTRAWNLYAFKLQMKDHEFTHKFIHCKSLTNQPIILILMDVVPRTEGYYLLVNMNEAESYSVIKYYRG